MRIALALVLTVHALAHLPGLLVPWRIATLAEMPYKTTVLDGTVDVGDVGIRVVGVLWLVAAIAIAVGAGGVLAGTSWGPSVALLAASFSALLCIGGWPEARLGLLVNAGIIILLFASRRAG
ncbi:MAG TPA: hypothetical protein VFP39_09420 [Gemmatimonadales bacterium]|nr:hypothetical protein [Gemmatimonadales bacterium]